MKGETRMTGIARVIGLLIALALLLSLLLPLVGAAAQEAEEDVATTEALSEVPTTGARRPGPVILAATRVAAPEPEPEPVEGVAPIALQVDSVGVDAPIELGAVADGAMLDPSGPWVVSWYEPLGKVGEGGNVVMAGHVDYWNVGPAVFWDIRNLPAGDVIRVVGEDGKNYEYAVQWIERYDAAGLTPEVIQNDIVGDTGEETLTLITCGGTFDPATGEYNERWVVRANLISA
jgi:sortase (surface protein transpeptidase)